MPRKPSATFAAAGAVLATGSAGAQNTITILGKVDWSAAVQKSGVLNLLAPLGIVVLVLVLFSVASAFHRRARRSAAKKKSRSKTAKVRAEPCPACGGLLKARRGRDGSFLGCTNYPTCRYTRDLNPR